MSHLVIGEILFIFKKQLSAKKGESTIIHPLSTFLHASAHKKDTLGYTPTK